MLQREPTVDLAKYLNNINPTLKTCLIIILFKFEKKFVHLAALLDIKMEETFPHLIFHI